MSYFCPACWDDKAQHHWPTRSCFQGGVRNQFCHAGTTPMRQKMSFREVVPEANTQPPFSSLLLVVCVGEKKSDFVNIGIRKTAGDTSCCPKRWAWGHSTFSNLSFHIFFWLSLPYFTTLPWILPIVLAASTSKLFFSVRKGPASFP